jgi:hypothetical protein
MDTQRKMTIQAIAAEQNLRIGFVLYLRGQPDFPLPVTRRRESLYDPAEIARYFGKKWVARC